MYVVGEGLPDGPLESEVVAPLRLAVIVGAHHARMLNTRAVPRLPQKALDRRGVALQPLSQYFERTGTALRMVGTVHLGRATLADALEEAIAGDRAAGQTVAGHGMRQTNAPT